MSICTYFKYGDLTGSSLQEIGGFFNRKDHSTVLYAVARIRDICKHQTEFDSKIKSLHSQLTN